MFTGIVQAVGILDHIDVADYGCQYCIRLPESFHDVSIGSSINVDGVCLTCVNVVEGGLIFDVVNHSIKVTNLGYRCVGDRLNCERSLRLGEEVGGHIVSGHISTTGQIVSITKDSGDARLKIQLDADWMRYIFDKGFVAIDGASLTVASIDMSNHSFEIALIPETLRSTALIDYFKGEYVNIEIESQTKILVDVLTRICSSSVLPKNS